VKDRNHVSAWTFLRGLFHAERACTLCSSPRVSRSHTKFTGLGPLLRLVAMRCRGCGARFSLRLHLAGPHRHREPTS
jgi:hypothetical protein